MSLDERPAPIDADRPVRDDYLCADCWHKEPGLSTPVTNWLRSLVKLPPLAPKCLAPDDMGIGDCDCRDPWHSRLI